MNQKSKVLTLLFLILDMNYLRKFITFAIVKYKWFKYET